LSVETGHRKRKNKTKKTFKFGDSPDATPENYHDDNIRRKDLIENDGEYQRLTHLNQPLERINEPKNSKISWKHFGDLVERCEVLLFLHCNSIWTIRETYLQRQSTQTYYEESSLHRDYCTYTNELNPQRYQQILAIHGQR
jgi:hypothetical protein